MMPNEYIELDELAKLVSAPLLTLISPGVRLVTPSEKVSVTGIGFCVVCPGCVGADELNVAVNGGGLAAKTKPAPLTTKPHTATTAAVLDKILICIKLWLTHNLIRYHDEVALNADELRIHVLSRNKKSALQ
jgi:hypothetical protein